MGRLTKQERAEIRAKMARDGFYAVICGTVYLCTICFDVNDYMFMQELDLDDGVVAYVGKLSRHRINYYQEGWYIVKFHQRYTSRDDCWQPVRYVD